VNDDAPFLDIGRGKPLLLLRGEDSSEAIWRNVAPLLAEAMRLVVPNEPATSGTQIEQTLRDAGVERFAILAHGDAGPIAFELSAGSDVEALVLIGAARSDSAEAERRLTEREVPVLLLWGEDDDLSTADDAERLSERLPTSTLALVPGAGHDVLESAAVTVVPLLFEYLRARYLGERHGHADAGGPVPVALTRRPDQT
jgi:pimeloyl-ACP methyl ester carboxylesterase